MYLVVNLIGIFVFVAIGVLLSKKRKSIQWRCVGALLALNVFLAWFLTSFSIGREIIIAAAAGFNWLVSVAYEGIAFAAYPPGCADVRYFDLHRDTALGYQMGR